jgi:hypothetical protein
LLVRISELIGQGFRSNSDTESEINSDTDFGAIRTDISE